MKPKTKSVASLTLNTKRLRKFKISKLKAFLGKLSLIFAQHPFLTCLFLFLFALIIGGTLFYKYTILAQKIRPELFEFLALKEKNYQEVLGVWQQQEKKFNEADLKEYPDPFEAATLTLEESEEGTPKKTEELTE
jgi:hypothetical protein